LRQYWSQTAPRASRIFLQDQDINFCQIVDDQRSAALALMIIGTNFQTVGSATLTALSPLLFCASGKGTDTELCWGWRNLGQTDSTSEGQKPFARSSVIYANIYTSLHKTNMIKFVLGCSHEN